MSNMATTNDAKSRRNSTGSIPSSDEMAKIMQVGGTGCTKCTGSTYVTYGLCMQYKRAEHVWKAQ